jgi:hypothetical protein
MKIPVHPPPPNLFSFTPNMTYIKGYFIYRVLKPLTKNQISMSKTVVTSDCLRKGSKYTWFQKLESNTSFWKNLPMGIIPPPHGEAGSCNGLKIDGVPPMVSCCILMSRLQSVTGSSSLFVSSTCCN